MSGKPMTTGETVFLTLLSTFVILLVFSITIGLSYNIGYQNGENNKRESFERLLVEKGFGKYETHPSPYKTFKFKDE